MRNFRFARSLLCVLLISVSLSSCAVSNTVQKTKVSSYSTNDVHISEAVNFKLNGSADYYSKRPSGDESLLLFWSSDCGHCENLIKTMRSKKINKSISGHIFTVAEDESVHDVEKFKDDFPIYIDADESVFDKYQLRYYPTLLVISKDNKIVGSAEGERSCRALLSEYLRRNGD